MTSRSGLPSLFHRSSTALACGLCLLAAGLTTRSALACSYPTPAPTLRGLPADGQEDVPTDVVPLYNLDRLNAFALENVSFVLRTEAGAPVATETEELIRPAAEIRPLEPLEPLTRYVLEATAPGATGEPTTLTLSFTTGAGPLSAPPEAPRATLQHWRFAADVELTSCDANAVGTCVALPQGELTEVLAMTPAGGRDASAFLVQGPLGYNLVADSALRGHPFTCVRLRQRAMNGVYSEPVKLCGADAETKVLAGNSSLSCTPSGIEHDGPFGDPPAPDATDTPSTPDAGPANGEASPVSEPAAPDGSDTSDTPGPSAAEPDVPRELPTSCAMGTMGASEPRSLGFGASLATAALLVGIARRRGKAR